MPTFHEVQFPPKIAYGASGGAEFNTSVTSTFAGFEQRNINWQKARGRWDVSTGLKNKADMDALQAFFRARFGKAYGFRFKDWTDYQAVGQNIGTGNGTLTAFQLTKTYTSGGNNYVREIKKPVTGTVKIYLNAVLQMSGYNALPDVGVPFVVVYDTLWTEDDAAIFAGIISFYFGQRAMSKVRGRK